MKHKFWDLRLYRSSSQFSDDGLVSFTATVEETDIYCLARKDLGAVAVELIKKYRNEIKSYIVLNPNFLTALLPVSPNGNPPEIIKQMIHFSAIADVGPMAGVAGAIAEFVGKDLLKYSNEVVVENGGDIFASLKSEKVVQLVSSPDGPMIKLKIRPEKSPLGICTSSGQMGHSKSFGLADSVTVISKSAILADCAATAVGNIVRSSDDIKPAIERAKKIKGVDGVIVVCGGRVGFFGDIEIV